MAGLVVPQPGPANIPPAMAAVNVPAHPAGIPTLHDAVEINKYLSIMNEMFKASPASIPAADYDAWYRYNVSVQAAYSNGTLIATLEPMITNALNIGIAPLQEAINNINVSVNNIAAKQANMNALHSQLRIHGANLPLFPLRKSVAGAGPAGNAAVNAIVNNVPGHPLAVGATVPSPPFPAAVNDVDNITANEICALQIIYNEDFGIVADDDLPRKIARFKRWMCGLP